MIVVTGATGQLGCLVVEALARLLPAAEVVAAVRQPSKAADLAARGVQVRAADYDRPSGLGAALAGADKVLLVSGNEVGRRLPQHAAVIAAAKAAGVGHLLYTSVLFADTTSNPVAPEHKATEQLIRDSGIPFTLLRNGWYTENYEQTVGQAIATGSFFGSAGEGRVGGVPRADYADAAVEALTGEGHHGRVYELAADQAWSYADLADSISRVAGRPVSYQDLPVDQHRQSLVDAGLPEQFAELLVGSDRTIAMGELATDSGDLRTLLGRPTTTLDEAVAAILKG